MTITTPAPVYDGNDNVTQTTTPDGAVATVAYNKDDEPTSQVTPPDTSALPSPKTTYAYDGDGNVTTITKPDGNVPGATPGSYTTTYGYDTINEQTSMTDAVGGLTTYGYDDVGNVTSVTDPNGNLTKYGYDLNHKVTQVTNAAGNVSKTAYDLDGLIVSQTDANGNTSLDTLDPDGQLVQQETPAQAPGAPLTYDVTQYVYDQAGHQTQVLSPRAIAAGFSATSSCVATLTCPFTQVTKYNADSQVSAQVSPYDPSDPTYNTPSETDYSYDNAGRMSSVSAPPSAGQTIRNVTNYAYFQNGWVQSTTDPWNLTSNYDYTNEGEQSSRTLIGAGGDMTRSQSWTYFPDGKLATVADNGVPTGAYSELTDNSDAGNPRPAGTWPTATTPSGFWGYNYQADVNGSAADSFTWNLHVAKDGNYSVYVWFPAVSGAVTNASYTVAFSGGSATATVDQTQHAGSWVKLGTWALSASATDETVKLAGHSGGTVVADAVKVVRDNSGDANTAHHDQSFGYDTDGNQTSISDTSPGAAVASYAMTYDQLDRLMAVTEDNSSGSAVHTTTYGYDAASNLTSRIHDATLSAPAYATYTYNNLNHQTKESDATSATDPSPQVTTFTYTPVGQAATEVKPNSNQVTYDYYANNLLHKQLETTSSGATVAQHVYQYNPNGDLTSDAETLMSADASGGDLTHTLTYAYDPLDRLETVSTDGTMTESYTHDANGNVIDQTVGNVQTTYTYDQNRLLQASANGTTADYNYDPLGRLDTVTSPGSQAPLESDTYDGFDNLVSQTTPSGITNYAYDPMNRLASQSSGGTTTSFSYLGLSSDLVTESQGGNVTKSYTYTPSGQRLAQAQPGAGGTPTYGYYSYDAHSDVEALTGSNGKTTATYGYTAYGQSIASMTTGADKSNISPGPTDQPYNSYRFNAMRWDSSSGQYDMGFCNYDPGLNQFVSRDMYDGALANMNLTADPFTGSPYAFGQGNPISNIELDGHMPCIAGGPCGSVQAIASYENAQARGNSYVPITPSFLVQRNDPYYQSMTSAIGAVTSRLGLSQQQVRHMSVGGQIAAWYMACGYGSGNTCPVGLNITLQGLMNHGPLDISSSMARVTAGTTFMVGSTFSASGGAAQLMPVRDANGVLRDALGRFARDPSAVQDDYLAMDTVHGNSLASPRTTYLYRLSDLEGNYLKTGISSDPFARYGPGIRGSTSMDILTSGPRAEMVNLERYIVSIDPGPWNNEPWAGSLMEGAGEDGGDAGGGGGGE